MWDERFEESVRRYLPYLPADEELAADTPLRDFGLDSLATVELLSALEASYDVRFQDEALSLATFETPEVLWKTLSRIREQV
ncbi:acyl carrier protein [Catenulispora sp. MAP5-51]|jgi:nodulation protein F|uniref:phosphopantetheine-binding protein n=1 Tax=unclassified Catenulispora TaxID=414885 RepID=UPI0035116770